MDILSISEAVYADKWATYADIATVITAVVAFVATVFVFFSIKSSYTRNG